MYISVCIMTDVVTLQCVGRLASQVSAQSQSQSQSQQSSRQRVTADADEE